MTIASTGPISLSSLQTEFGGANPISLSEYYRSGSYVETATVAGLNGLIPTTGTVPFSKYRGAAKIVAQIVATMLVTFPTFGGGGGIPINNSYTQGATLTGLVPGVTYRLWLLGYTNFSSGNAGALSIQNWANVTAAADGTASYSETFINNGSPYPRPAPQSRYYEVYTPANVKVATSNVRNYTND